MDSKNVNVGDVVTDSPVGGGKVTGFNHDGYPEVEGKAVGYFTREDGEKFGAFGTLDTPKRKMGREEEGEPSKTAVAPMSTKPTSAAAFVPPVAATPVATPANLPPATPATPPAQAQAPKGNNSAPATLVPGNGKPAP